jgi:hypothetical protein
MGGKKRLLAASVLALCAALAGCVTMGRPIDRVRRSDIPLVPVPPPPLSAPAEAAAPVARAAHTEVSAPAATTNPTTPPARIEPPAPGAPAAPTAAPTTTAGQLIKTAQARYATIDSYIVRLTRREMVRDTLKPEEVILFKFRKEPWSVSLKWLGKEGQGREVVYVKGRHDNKLHTLLAAGDVLIMPAGTRLALAPDSLMVRAAARHPISEAGIGASIDRLAALEATGRKGGTLSVLGPLNRPEFEKPVFALENRLAPGVDSTLKKGGKRTYFFHPDSGLPTLVQTTDERGQLVEYYRYDRLQPAVKLDDADFDPDQLWGKPKPAATAGR